MCGEGLVIRPGDHVLVGVSGQLTHQVADEYKRRLRERFPECEFTLIDNLAQIAVFRSYPGAHQFIARSEWPSESRHCAHPAGPEGTFYCPHPADHPIHRQQVAP